jgi:ectoine hydroxylase-related dioxygenase (phytanoyl-CoA dioxygenase family)
MNNEPLTRVTDEDVSRFRRDGVICLRNVLDAEWIDLLRGNVERYLNTPSEAGHDAAGGSGRFQLDYQMWLSDEDQKKFIFGSPAGRIAALMMNSEKAYLTVDLMLVKEPHTPQPTPWHSDTFYGWYEGSQMVSMWVGLDSVTKESGAVEFVRGSHLWGNKFLPPSFGGGGDLGIENLEPVPDIEAARGKYDIVHFDTEPGDIIVNSLDILHSAPGNSTDRRRRAIAFRFGGDDCRYVQRPGSMKPIIDPGIRSGDPIGCSAFPQVWPRSSMPGEAATAR